MEHRLFISHSAQDKEIAEVISTILKRISLGQLSTWFSSDQNADGGLIPGNVVFDEIIHKITTSDAVIVLLTPNSINRPWLLYESGIAEALDNCLVMPICVSITRDSVSPPLGFYQCYQLSDYFSLKEFISKLLKRFNIVFDEDMFKPILEKAIFQLAQFSFNKDDNAKSDLEQMAIDLKNHIDKRFIEMMNYQENSGNTQSTKAIPLESSGISYTIPIEIDSHSNIQYIEIRNTDSVQDVLDRIYFLLAVDIKAYTYMNSWILRDKITDKNLVIYEISDSIPAKFVFNSKFQWQVIKLNKSYQAPRHKSW